VDEWTPLPALVCVVVGVPAGGVPGRRAHMGIDRGGFDIDDIRRRTKSVGVSASVH